MSRVRAAHTALAIAAALLVSACDPQSPFGLPLKASNGRCGQTGVFARDRQQVLQCKAGRYRKLMSLQRASQLIAEYQRGQSVPSQSLGVLLVGDSFATSLFPGIQAVREVDPSVTPHNAAVIGCGIGRGGWSRGTGVEQPLATACTKRDEGIQFMIRERSPRVAVVAGGLWDVTDRRLDGDEAWRAIGDPIYDNYLFSEALHLIDLLSSAGLSVVWTTSPHWAPSYVPALLMGPPPYAEADPARADRYNEIIRAAVAQRPAVLLVDLAAFMQTLPGGEFAPTLRTDGVHLNPEGSRRVAEWLLPHLKNAASPAG